MPDIKGDELALIIKSLVPAQALAMITAHPGPLASNLWTEVDVIVAKPFNTEEFCNAVSRFWNRVDPAVTKQIETDYFRKPTLPSLPAAPGKIFPCGTKGVKDHY